MPDIIRDPPPFFSPPPLLSPPALSRKSRRKIHEPPRHDVSAATFIRIAFCIRPRIVAGTMARAATIMRPPPIPPCLPLPARSLRLCIFHGGLCCSCPAAIKTFHRLFVFSECLPLFLPSSPRFCFSCLLILFFFLFFFFWRWLHDLSFHDIRK